MCFKRKKTGGHKNNITTFYIPAGNNSITVTDIKKGQVRITKDNKEYFPEYDCDIQIRIADKYFTVKFRLGNNKDKVRSHMLKLGCEVIDLLGLKSGDCLAVQRIDEYTYTINNA